MSQFAKNIGELARALRGSDERKLLGELGKMFRKIQNMEVSELLAARGVVTTLQNSYKDNQEAQILIENLQTALTTRAIYWKTRRFPSVHEDRLFLDENELLQLNYMFG